MTAPTEEVDRPVAPAGPTSAALVSAWSGKPADAKLEAAVAATNRIVRRLIQAPVDGQPWPEDHELGTRLLAARIRGRAETPGGLAAAITEAGIAYTARTDPEVAMLLGIGVYARPVVG